MLNHKVLLEICAGSLSDVIAASSVKETDRIELNCALELGGLTPSLQTLVRAKQKTDIPLICMVRPRPAGFIYNNDEKETMLADAETFLQNGADGIVFGCLKEDHTVDEEFTVRMVQLIHSYGKEAVFHKAFDDAKDPDAAVQALIRCRVDRILTSGLQPDVLQGKNMIAYLQKTYGKEIQILPGGGVTKDNIRIILADTGCTQIHMTAKTARQNDGSYYAVDAAKINAIVRHMQDTAESRILTREDRDMLKQEQYEQSLYVFQEDDERRN